MVSKVKKKVEKEVANVTRKIDTLSKKKLKNKRVFKNEKPSLKIKHREIPSVLNDPNRFFKDEMMGEFELWNSHSYETIILGGEKKYE